MQTAIIMRLTMNRPTDPRMSRIRQLVAGMLALAAGAAFAPAAGQRPALALLDQLEHGRWEVRLRDGSRTVYPLCIDSGRTLLQLRHPMANCDRIIVADQPDLVTVQYTCRGQGYGRTSIRRETNRLVQIETQGIAQGLPFDFLAEARRIGDCPA